jgi:hypothetical protein
LAWKKEADLQAWIEYIEGLLNIQNIGEDGSEDNRVPKSSSKSDKITFVTGNNTSEK